MRSQSCAVPPAPRDHKDHPQPQSLKGGRIMAETLQKEPVYSSERIETAPLGGSAEVPPNPEPAPANVPIRRKQELAQQLGALVERASAGQFRSLADLAEFFKRTRRAWLSIAAAILAVVVGVSSAQRLSAWLKHRRETRQEKALATLTPEHLIARCGQPATDVTQNVYPVLLRTITYQTSSGQNLILAFSRTAEEKSDWVFLSMKDSSGAAFDTNAAQIAAFSCLDSTK